jgi:hypothetical protein
MQTEHDPHELAASRAALKHAQAEQDPIDTPEMRELLHFLEGYGLYNHLIRRLPGWRELDEKLGRPASRWGFAALALNLDRAKDPDTGHIRALNALPQEIIDALGPVVAPEGARPGAPELAVDLARAAAARIVALAKQVLDTQATAGHLGVIVAQAQKLLNEQLPEVAAKAEGVRPSLLALVGAAIAKMKAGPVPLAKQGHLAERLAALADSFPSDDPEGDARDLLCEAADMLGRPLENIAELFEVTKLLAADIDVPLDGLTLHDAAVKLPGLVRKAIADRNGEHAPPADAIIHDLQKRLDDAVNPLRRIYNVAGFTTNEDTERRVIKCIKEWSEVSGILAKRIDRLNARDPDAPKLSLPQAVKGLLFDAEAGTTTHAFSGDFWRVVLPNALEASARPDQYEQQIRERVCQRIAKLAAETHDCMPNLSAELKRRYLDAQAGRDAPDPRDHGNDARRLDPGSNPSFDAMTARHPTDKPEVVRELIARAEAAEAKFEVLDKSLRATEMREMQKYAQLWSLVSNILGIDPELDPHEEMRSVLSKAYRWDRACMLAGVRIDWDPRTTKNDLDAAAEDVLATLASRASAPMLKAAEADRQKMLDMLGHRAEDKPTDTIARATTALREVAEIRRALLGVRLLREGLSLAENIERLVAQKPEAPDLTDIRQRYNDLEAIRQELEGKLVEAELRLREKSEALATGARKREAMQKLCDRWGAACKMLGWDPGQPPAPTAIVRALASLRRTADVPPLNIGTVVVNINQQPGKDDAAKRQADDFAESLRNVARAVGVDGSRSEIVKRVDDFASVVTIAASLQHHADGVAFPAAAEFTGDVGDVEAAAVDPNKVADRLVADMRELARLQEAAKARWSWQSELKALVDKLGMEDPATPSAVVTASVEAMERARKLLAVWVGRSYNFEDAGRWSLQTLLGHADTLASQPVSSVEKLNETLGWTPSRDHLEMIVMRFSGGAYTRESLRALSDEKLAEFVQICLAREANP